MLIDQKFVHNGNLYRRDAQGDLYVWVATPGFGELGGLWKKIKKIHKKVTKVVKKIVKAPIQLHQKIKREVLKSKYGRAIVTGAGAVFAPFTGGASLAAAQALTRYGKARYGQGLSRSEAYKRGAVGGAIGYVAGVGLVYGAGQLGIGAAATPGLAPSFLTPFGTAAAPIVSAAAPGASIASPFTVGAAPVVTSAAAPTTFLAKIGSALATIGKTLLPIVPQLAAARGGSPGGSEFDPAMIGAGVPYGGAYSDEYGGGGGGGYGGPNMPPAIDPETGEPIEAGPGQISPLMLAAALGGLVFFTMNGGRRSRKRARRGRK